MSATPLPLDAVLEPVAVHARFYGGAYLARCEGKTASATSHPAAAAARAAARHFRSVDTRVALRPVTEYSFLALPDGERARDQGYRRYLEIMQAELGERYPQPPPPAGGGLSRYTRAPYGTRYIPRR